MKADPEFKPVLENWGSEKAVYVFVKKEIRPDQLGCIRRKSRNADVEEKSVSSEKTGRRSGLKLYSFNDGYLLSLKRCHLPSAS
jgi:hypothetical protein